VIQRDHLGDRFAGAADDDLFAVLDALDDPREVGLRVVDVLNCATASGITTSLARRLVRCWVGRPVQSRMPRNGELGETLAQPRQSFAGFE